ncbi:MAG: type II toxin-antitoxin system RelE/ParE family toxin [Ignavibacteriales bacterium]|nr:type II toxin-antitoxin system RelE/ParE family toxin [Ignavibacteriales bacterium]
MALYKLLWKKSAISDLSQIEQSFIANIIKAVEELQTNPFPYGFKKLSGADKIYRIRVGQYRIIYSVFQNILTIEIVRVRHRKDVYK